MKKLARNISVLLITLLFACCMVAGLAACGDDEGSVSGSGNASPSTNYENSDIFEAEWTDLASATYGTRGWRGYSMNLESLTKETGSKMNCSNGYYIGSMYIRGSYIFYTIESDIECDAALYANLTMDYECMTDSKANSVTLTDEQFTVCYGDASISGYAEGTAVEYGSIEYSMKKLKNIGTHNAFAEYYLGEIHLVAGTNVIIMETTNSIRGQGGTMSALAPLIDYIRIESDANLSWDPIYNDVNNDGN